MASSDATLMNILMIMFQGGKELRKGLTRGVSRKLSPAHAMPCTLHTWHTTGIPSPKRNSINFVILEGSRRDARSLLLTAGLHHYANNTASSRNNPLFVIHDEALSRKA